MTELKPNLYVRRCGWCGAYEGTVPFGEPCQSATDPATGEIMGPHQFGVWELATGETVRATMERDREVRKLERAAWVVAVAYLQDAGIKTADEETRHAVAYITNNATADAILGEEPEDE